MAAIWKVTLLGTLRADAGEHSVTRFRTQKAALLFAYLALHTRYPHPRDFLIGLLWPDADLDSGRNSLSIALSSLRHQLEPPGTVAGSVLAATRSAVQLRPEAVSVDVHAFTHAIRQARQAAGPARIALLSQAVERYSGPLLIGFYDDWVLDEQNGLADLYYAGVRDLLAEYERSGATDRAIECARRAVAADRLREEAHRDLIRLLLAAGEAEAARRHYRALEKLLEQELGERPGTATRALAGEIERRMSAAPQVPAQPPVLAQPPADPRAGGTSTLVVAEVADHAGAERSARDAATLLVTHRTLLYRELRRAGGLRIAASESSLTMAFARAGEAIAGVAAACEALAVHPWPPASEMGGDCGPDRVRIVMETGDLEWRGGRYLGPALERAALLLTAAHPGQILCSEATACLLRRDPDPPFRLADLGRYRLHAGNPPERLTQIDLPGASRYEFPPPRLERAHPSNLPAPGSRFFGREPEIARLVALLAPASKGQRVESNARAEVAPDPLPRALSSLPSARLVTLTGVGGAGKTRLALEAAARLVEAFEGNVWFAPLADVSDAEALPGRLRDMVGLPRSPATPALEQLVEALSGKPALIVLDNFEQLLVRSDPPHARTHAAAHLLGSLLERLPDLSLLVTSRRRLALAAEVEVAIAPLATPAEAHAPAAPEALVANESVQLFLDRAQTVRPDFQVTPRNAAAISDLCRRLDGLPLAIELAASRSQVLTPAQMLEQMAHRFAFLVGRERDSTARHYSLAVTLEWSVRLLPPELQRFFARLAVFAGGWTLDAAETIAECGSPPLRAGNPQYEVLDYLAQLRECSLITSEESGAEMRFRALETIREYAAEQLTAAELEVLRRRHAEFYAGLADRAAVALTGPQQRSWLDRLEVEQANLRSALVWSLEAAPAVALRLAGALWRFWMGRGFLMEGRAWLARALAAPAEGTIGAAAAPEPAVRARALLGAAVLAHLQGEDQEAHPLALESRRLYAAAGNPPGAATVLAYLGDIVDGLEDPALAKQTYEACRALAVASEDLGALAYALSGLGRLASGTGAPEAAPLLEKSLALFREIGDGHHISMVLWHLGYLALYQGQTERAEQLFEEDLALSRALGDTRHIATGLCNLATVAMHREDYAGACSLFEEGLRLHRQLGQRRSIAGTLSRFGCAAASGGNDARARSLHEEALCIRRSLGHRDGILDSLLHLGYVALRRHDRSTARDCFIESVEIARGTDYQDHLLTAIQGAGATAAAMGDFRRAELLFGAVEGLSAGSLPPLRPEERQVLDRYAALAGMQLGEADASRIRAAGRGLSPEQAAACAVEINGPGPRSSP